MTQKLRDTDRPLGLQLNIRTQGFRGRVEMIFIEDSGQEDPVGGIELVTKPPPGKCSINIKKQRWRLEKGSLLEHDRW
jgi:hypothetical protein